MPQDVKVWGFQNGIIFDILPLATISYLYPWNLVKILLTFWSFCGVFFFFPFFGLFLFLISETFRMEPSYTKLHKTEDSHWP